MGRIMTGPINVYTIAEMNRRAEEAALKVRTELFRIGCAPKKIQVLKQGYYLQVRYRQQIILADPEEVLSALQKMPVGLEVPEIWGKILNNVCQVRQQSVRRIAWGIAAVVIPVALGLAWIFLRGR